MFYLLSVFIGILISFMILQNGNLNDLYLLYTSTFIIHLVGFIFIILVTFIKKEKIFTKGVKLFLYIGGILGVFNILFNNLAFGKISISAILALTLVGQGITSLIIDSFGLLGAKKEVFDNKKIIGIVIMCIGCYVILIG